MNMYIHVIANLHFDVYKSKISLVIGNFHSAGLITGVSGKKENGGKCKGK